MKSKENRSAREIIQCDISKSMEESGVIKTSDKLGIHSGVINHLSRNSERIIKAKNKAIWRLSFEVSFGFQSVCLLACIEWNLDVR